MRIRSNRISATRTGMLAVAAAVLLCAIAFAGSSAPSAVADPGATTATTSVSTSTAPVDAATAQFQSSLAVRQADIETLKSELASMDAEAEIADQQYDRAKDQLDQLNSRVKAAQTGLDDARQAYAVQTRILSQRAQSIYKDGAVNGVQMLLDSASVSDFIARVKFLNAMGIADANYADALKAQKDIMEAELVDLKNSQAKAASLEFEMRARKIEINLDITEREDKLNSTQSNLVVALNNEASRKQAQEAKLFNQAISGSNKAGIVIAAGSPVETALAYRGVPYLWGGATPSGFDCSGLVMYVFAQHGVNLPHYSGSQFQLGQHVDLAAIQPNDVVFFGNPVHHVGLYCGGGYFIEAPHTGDFVKIAKLSDWNGQIAGVRRYPWVQRVGPPKGAVTSPASALQHVP